jgi:hypothetical protein
MLHDLKRIDFEKVNGAALRNAPAVLKRWLPDGHLEGNEFVAKNPRRADRRHGSFKVNTYSGKWCDFASGDKGGDLVSLGAYLAGISQGEAARRIADMLGVPLHG